MTEYGFPLLWGSDRPVRHHDFVRLSEQRRAECIWQEWHLSEPLMAYRTPCRARRLMPWLVLVSAFVTAVVIGACVWRVTHG